MLLAVILCLLAPLGCDRRSDEQKVSDLAQRYFGILTGKLKGQRYEMLSAHLQEGFRYYAHEQGFKAPQDYAALYEKLFPNDEGMVSFSFSKPEVRQNVATLDATLKYKKGTDKLNLWFTREGGKWKIGR